MSNLTTLDLAALETVTGGKDGAHSLPQSNTAALEALNGINSSLANLKTQSQSSGSGGLFNNPTNMALFAMCLANRPAPSNVVVVRHW